jgi:hypothetical protein
MQLSAGRPKISKGKKEEKALYFGIPVASGQVDANCLKEYFNFRHGFHG